MAVSDILSYRSHVAPDGIGTPTRSSLQSVKSAMTRSSETTAFGQNTGTLFAGGETRTWRRQCGGLGAAAL